MRVEAGGLRRLQGFGLGLFGLLLLFQRLLFRALRHLFVALGDVGLCVGAVALSHRVGERGFRARVCLLGAFKCLLREVAPFLCAYALVACVGEGGEREHEEEEEEDGRAARAPYLAAAASLLFERGCVARRRAGVEERHRRVELRMVAMPPGGVRLMLLAPVECDLQRGVLEKTFAPFEVKRGGLGQSPVDARRLRLFRDPVSESPPVAYEALVRDVHERLFVERDGGGRHEERAPLSPEHVED